jgi:hypothetical protein
VQRAFGHRLGDKRVEAGLRHRAAAAADLIDLGGVDINPPDVLAAGCQAGSRHGPDIAKTYYCDLHRLTSQGSAPPNGTDVDMSAGVHLSTEAYER